MKLANTGSSPAAILICHTDGAAVQGITNRFVEFANAEFKPALATNCTEPSAKPMLPVPRCRSFVQATAAFVRIVKIPGGHTHAVNSQIIVAGENYLWIRFSGVKVEEIADVRIAQICERDGVRLLFVKVAMQKLRRAYFVRHRLPQNPRIAI